MFKKEFLRGWPLLACLQRGSPFSSSLLWEFWALPEYGGTLTSSLKPFYPLTSTPSFSSVLQISTFLYPCILGNGQVLYILADVLVFRIFSYWTPRTKCFKDAHSLGALQSQQYFSGASRSRLLSLQSCDGGQILE